MVDLMLEMFLAFISAQRVDVEIQLAVESLEQLFFVGIFRFIFNIYQIFLAISRFPLCKSMAILSISLILSLYLRNQFISYSVIVMVPSIMKQQLQRYVFASANEMIINIIHMFENGHSPQAYVFPCHFLAKS